jgi:pyruvate,water dikinase
MLGFRGASRYIAQSFRDCFRLECEAMRKVRDTMGPHQRGADGPFVRTVKEGEQVLAIMKEYGLERGKNGLRVVMMCEIPSNAILADEFLKHFDGFSIGSNDMTQLTLAARPRLGPGDGGVRRARRGGQAHAAPRDPGLPQGGKYVGICGQGPSDYPDLAEWLMEQGSSRCRSTRIRSCRPGRRWRKKP